MGNRLLGGAKAPDDISFLQHQYAHSRTRQISRAAQAIVARTNNDDVMAGVQLVITDE
jgi:hypothetical protein